MVMRLARGMSAKEGMAELLGKATGCSKGKGGSMHFFDVEKGFLGGHAIVGSHIPLAAGVAFASKYRGEDRVCMCYFGDGAVNQGGVHEALNMAALWKLPVIYIVENNQYAMGTSLARSSAVLDLTLRCAVPYGIPGYSINGNDIELMAKTTREAANRARAGEGPDLHRRPDLPLQGPLDQRPGQVSPQGRARNGDPQRPDPASIENVLKERGWIDQEAIDRMLESVKEEVEESIEFAEQSDPPAMDALYEDITVAPFIPQE